MDVRLSIELLVSLAFPPIRAPPPFSPFLSPLIAFPLSPFFFFTTHLLPPCFLFSLFSSPPPLDWTLVDKDGNDIDLNFSEEEYGE